QIARFEEVWRRALLLRGRLRRRGKYACVCYCQHQKVPHESLLAPRVWRPLEHSDFLSDLEWPFTHRWRPLRNAAAFRAEASDVAAFMNAITGIADCCARAASGHAAAPPSSVMKARRFN